MIAPNPALPHEPTVECDAHHCAFHNVDEHGSYYTCGECLHNYASEAELLAAVERKHLELGIKDMPSSGEDVVVCPHCGHDF